MSQTSTTMPGTDTGLPWAPAVTVVIATRGRPVLLRQAVASVLAQDYTGPLDVVVVYDQVDVDTLDDVAVPEGRRLRTIPNVRTTGLAGGRNTGIEAATGELVAFCDDDDAWLPGKLGAQVRAWEQDPSAAVVATGIRIESEGGAHVRTPPTTATFEDFLASRLTEVHPSSFLLRRADLLGSIGLVDEDLPASYGEDYDLLLRATQVGHVRCVPDPLVVVNWNRPSFFTGRWEGIAAGLSYLLAKFPEFETSPRGTARVAGQVAFAHAALGDRPEARRWAWAALRRDPRQLRAHAALLVALRLAPPGWLVATVNRFGRGL
ncbi:glycosyltransferase family 2 protein [Cellulomonas bogoriensis]|uniref:Glycosyl transferase family 2 n=1 Tax=Cellulomonas bogoriensis 69B4 = DSM 16987 TaxID=1386082 RepID=A0A0A0C1U1_9CELL|nr:glycosyltransferase family 2 protein [Cellulomonas bogoriensis]KGM13947.1 glycosyl transferase family 2 [Cellulomonas bogoriensis 69B4 = DSM 16987]